MFKKLKLLGVGIFALLPVLSGCGNTSELDQATVESSYFNNIDNEGKENWLSHCSMWHAKYHKNADSKTYTYDFDFSGYNRGSAKIIISNLRIDGVEIWEPILNNKVTIQWHCKVDTWPSGKSEVYVKPRLAIINKKNNQVSRFEESGYGVESIRSDGNHYVRLNKDEYRSDISTGPKDVFDKMADKYKDEEHNDYYAIIDQIKVTVILKNV